jgi:hypothetical protein
MCAGDASGSQFIEMQQSKKRNCVGFFLDKNIDLGIKQD